MFRHGEDRRCGFGARCNDTNNPSILCSNTYLYRFLKTQTENNIALKETDQKKNRKRNFVPASLGIVHIFLLVLSYSGAML